MNKKQKNILILTIILLFIQLFLLAWSAYSYHKEQEKRHQALIKCEKKLNEGVPMDCYVGQFGLNSDAQKIRTYIIQGVITGIPVFATIWISISLFRKNKTQ